MPLLATGCIRPTCYAAPWQPSATYMHHRAVWLTTIDQRAGLGCDSIPTYREHLQIAFTQHKTDLIYLIDPRNLINRPDR